MEKVLPEDFFKADLRVGLVIAARPFPEARKPAYILTIDFGESGILKSSAQITALYSPEELVGKHVIAVVNFPPRQIGPAMSECLVLGAPGENGVVVLLQPDRPVAKGTKIS